MQITNRLLESTKLNEGYRKFMYKCTMGRNTIGYGYNLDAGMEPDEAEALLRIKLSKAIDFLVTTYPWMLHIPKEAQEVFIEMAYQLGHRGFSMFRRMLAAAEKGDWSDAASEMYDSNWFFQTPNRVRKLAKTLENLRY